MTGSLPLRPLTPFELQTTLSDVLGDPAVELAGLQPPAIVSGVETAGEKELRWSGGRADLLEQALFAVATRATSGTGKLAACAAGGSDLECFRGFLSETLPLLYRRAVSSDDVKAVVTVAEANVAALGRKEAMARALESALMSVETLYLTSVGLQGKPTGELSAYELAARMSYAVWASAPDKELLDAATKGDLSAQTGIDAQAKRLLADPRSQRGIARFVLAWSNVLNLPSRAKSGGSWSSAIANDALTETNKYVGAWWSGNAPTFATLLNNDKSYLTQALADYYGVPFPGGTGAQQVTMPPSSYRLGLLTQASFLTTSTAGGASSPTLRGRWAMERLMCMPQGLPDANTVSKAPTHVDGEQTRDYHEKLAAAEGCKGCHVNMEAAGVPFERFDGYGKLRLQESGKPVRVDTVLKFGKDADGTYADESAYFKALGNSSTVRACVASYLVRYALGRSPADSDAPIVAKVSEQLGTDARAAMLTLVTSPNFRALAKP